MDHARSIMRFGIWSAAVCAVIALGVRDVQLDRTIRTDLHTRANRPGSYLSAIGPPVRVDVSSGDVVITGEPVYASLRLPRWFDRVLVELQYENPHHLPFRVGVRTHPLRWQYDVKTVETDGRRTTPATPHPDVEVVEYGPIRTVRIPFALQRSWQIDRNVSQFILSIPGASPEQPFILHALQVTAERDPVCVGRLCI